MLLLSGASGLQLPAHAAAAFSSVGSSSGSGGGRGEWAVPRLAAAVATTRRVAVAPQCCICINCKLVDRCKLYHWVETMHEQPHVTDDPTFDPADPQIQVFLRNETTVAESDDSEAQVVRPFLSTEYDVFACDAFDEDKGKWLRLMPDAEYIPT